MAKLHHIICNVVISTFCLCACMTAKAAADVCSSASTINPNILDSGMGGTGAVANSGIGGTGAVANSGMGARAVDTAKKYSVETPVILESLNFRIASQGNPSYTGKLVSVMRNQFGGHEVDKKE